MKNLLQKLAIVGSTLALAFGLLGPSTVFADCPAGDTISSCFSTSSNSITIQSQFGFKSLSQTINTIVSVIFFGAALVAFLFIVIGAFQYLTSGDSDAGTKAARTRITNAVVGLILIALVYVIFQIAIRIVPGLNSFFNFV